MAKSKYKYLFKNTFLFTISSFSSKILSFLLVPLYTTVLSTADYGTADMVFTTSSLVVFVVALNISDAVLRYVIDRESNQNEILGYGIKVTLIGNLFFAFILSILAGLKVWDWKSYLYLFLFLHVSITSFMNLISNYLRAIDKIKEVAISGIISTVATILCNIVTLLILKIGIYGYLISMVIGPFMSLLYCLSKSGNIWTAIRCATKDRKIKHEMLVYCIPLILNGIAWWINASLDKYFIVGYCGVSDNGIYSVAQKIPTILTTFASIFLQAWNLSAIREFDKDDKDGFFSNTYNLLNACLVMLCSLIILLNIPISKILYAKDFFVAWKCSSWLLISTVFSAMSSYEGSIFAAVKNSKIASISTLVSAFVNLILNIILIQIIGIQGAAIATVISFISVWSIRFIYLKKIIKLRINMFENIISYVLLFLQVLLERISDHCYWGQVVIIIIIIFIYRNNIVNIGKPLLSRVKN